MSPVLLVVLALAAVFVLILLHVPIGIAMVVVGVVSFASMSSWTAAFGLMSAEPASMMMSLDIGVIPLFLLMGAFATAGGLSDDIYRLAHALLGHRRGGLGVATVLGCGLFGSIAGSSVATTATFGRLALPQMRSRGYEGGFASGTIACGGTLGAMVPPSVILVIYGIIAEQFILDLFVAAVIPALLAIVGYVFTIWAFTKLRPDVAPTGPRADWTEVRAALWQCRAALVLFVCVSGGIYGGVFQVTEAASLGALLSVAFAGLRGRLTRRVLVEALRSTAAATGMIYVAIFGASIMSYFIGLTRVSDELVALLQGMNIPPLAVISLLVVMYLVLGAVFDETAAMLITLPFVLPIVTGFGYDPLWWGIINLVVINLGMVIPPIGMNVFLLHGLSPDIPLRSIYRGVMPFIGIDLIRLALLILFPGLSLWLVQALK